MTDLRFPDGFLWGTGASAYQVEGAWDADGKGPSIWDTAAHTDPRMRPSDGTSGDLAIDQYHRLEEDLDLLAQLAAPVHRFSVSWPRVLPDGRQLNVMGLDYYERLVDGMLSRGLVPVANLFHWELPQVLSDEGGWLTRDTAFRFGEYAAAVADRLGDRVAQWYTMNEPTHPTLGGYVAGFLPPFQRLGRAGMASVHHLLLAHGLAVQALKARTDSPVGIILSLSGVKAATDHFDDQAAAARASELIDGVFLHPVLKGLHLPELSAVLGDSVHEGDLAIIKSPLDRLGVNWYSRHTVAAPARAARHVGEAAADYRQMFAMLGDLTRPLGFAIVPEPGARWTESHRQVTPGGLGEMLLWLREHYPESPPLIISENGIGLRDLPDADGIVNDQARIEFLSGNISEVHQAIAAGIDVRGFWVWAAWDNLQWFAGFSQRFGLVHVALPDLTRTPKASFHWFADVIKRHALPVPTAAEPSAVEPWLVSIPNARDVGGLPLATGGRVKPGLLVRSGHLGAATAEDLETLGALGLRSILDLRGAWEREAAPDPDMGHARRIEQSIGAEITPAAMDEFDLSDFYHATLRQCAPGIAAAIDELATPGSMPALVHCSAGKDRTGIVVGLLLSLIGVPDFEVVTDYAASAQHLGDAFRDALKAAVGTGAEAALAAGVLDSPPELMQAVLDLVRKEGCTVEGWLTDNGLRPGAADSLRSTLCG